MPQHLHCPRLQTDKELYRRRDKTKYSYPQEKEILNHLRNRPPLLCHSTQTNDVPEFASPTLVQKELLQNQPIPSSVCATLHYSTLVQFHQFVWLSKNEVRVLCLSCKVNLSSIAEEVQI